MPVTEEKPKQKAWYQTKIEQLEEQNESLKAEIIALSNGPKSVGSIPLKFVYDPGDSAENITTTSLFMNLAGERTPLLRRSVQGSRCEEALRLAECSGYNTVNLERMARSQFERCWKEVLKNLEQWPAFTIDSEIVCSFEVR